MRSCNDCGAVDIQGSACHDCGSENLTESGNDANVSATGASVAAMPEMPGMTVAGADRGPVVATIGLTDGRILELREGDAFTVANEATDQDVAFKVNDPTVSRTPVRIFVQDGVPRVTGGGGNGFAISTTVRHKPAEVIELPRGLTVAVVVGKDTRLNIK